MTERKISAVQLSLLLFLCSLSGILSGRAALLEAAAYPLGMAVVWLALSPAYLLARRRSGLLPALGKTAKALSLPVAAVLTLFCAAMAARFLDSFSLFMTSTVYPTARAGIFLICTGFVCAYAAGMGLEPLARLGLWIAVLAAVTFAVLAAGLAPSMRLIHVGNPFAGGSAPILNAAGRFACATSECILFLLLIPRTRGGKSGRVALSWLVMAAAAAAAAGLVVTAALGPYAGSRRYPLHTASAAAHFSPQGRMDLLFLFLFVLAAFTRIALWLYGGCLCLRRLFPRMRRGACALLCGLAAIGLGFLPRAYAATGTLLTGWALLFAAVLPLCLLASPAGKGGAR